MVGSYGPSLSGIVASQLLTGHVIPVIHNGDSWLSAKIVGLWIVVDPGDSSKASSRPALLKNLNPCPAFPDPLVTIDLTKFKLGLFVLLNAFRYSNPWLVFSADNLPVAFVEAATVPSGADLPTGRRQGNHQR